MKHLILMLSALVAVSAGHAQVAVHEKSPETKYAFTLASPRQTAAILYDASDAAVVKRAAELFAADVEAVTGRRPQVTSATGETGPAVIVGTVGGSALIRRLSEAGKIDTAPLEGAWERYLIQTVANPLPGIRKALVIAGSDRRGAAYGLFTLSELIGVSPWYWWADVPVKKHAALHVDAPPTYSQTPSVRYRGIFLNDEDWGLTPWASQTFEPERGNIGPRTYAKVCELLLRLKANYLAPAMHPVSTSFNQIPENKLVADTFAIVMGSTHCEPLLLNTASEWDTQTMGPWNYDKNKEGINRVLTQRVRENSPYENVYTLALRGLHDGAMSTTLPMHEKVRMLQQALLDQRQILAENIDRPVETVPQAFTPYKEVLEIYSNGLELPDDVTIVWPDDNYGYMKRLSGVRDEVQRCYDSLQVITRGYNSLLGGKWNHMMSMRQNYDGVSAYFNLPHLATHDAAGAPRLALQVAGEDVTGARAFHALPAFDNYLRRTYPVEIYNRGGGTLAWTAHASEPWVVLSKSAGKTADEERITVGIDWEKAPSGNAVPAQIVFRAGEQSEKVLVSLFNPTAPSRAELRGIYVENNGCVSIPAAGCHRVRENDRIKITAVEDLGIEGPALQLGDPTAPLQIFRSRDVPCAEYDFYAFDAGSVDVYTYVLPTFPLHADRDFRIGENTNTDTKYSVQIDDGALATPSSSHVEYSQVWFESVLRNCAVNKSTLHIDKPGRHTLRIRVGDPGIVLQKIVLDFGGMKRSYLGPQSTLIE